MLGYMLTHTDQLFRVSSLLMPGHLANKMDEMDENSERDAHWTPTGRSLDAQNSERPAHCSGQTGRRKTQRSGASTLHSELLVYGYEHCWNVMRTRPGISGREMQTLQTGSRILLHPDRGHLHSTVG